jgi:hypothetical protein
MVILFNATFNNISVISWRSVLLMDETKAPRENHSSAASHCQTLFFRVVSSTSGHGNIHMEVLFIFNVFVLMKCQCLGIVL